MVEVGALDCFTRGHLVRINFVYLVQRKSFCNWNLGWDFGTTRFECTEEERSLRTVFPRKLFSWIKISPKETEP